MKKYIFLFAFYVMSAYTVAAENQIPLKKDMAFQTANTKLCRSGWHPRTMHTKDQYIPIGLETTLPKDGLQESKIAQAISLSASSTMRKETWGEEFKDLKVVAWSRDCPPADAL